MFLAHYRIPSPLSHNQTHVVIKAETMSCLVLRKYTQRRMAIHYRWYRDKPISLQNARKESEKFVVR